VKVDPKFNGQWKEKEKEKVPFHLFPFSPKQLYLDLRLFSFDVKVLLTMVLGRYLHISSLFFGL
jgi:hypothetical protein